MHPASRVKCRMVRMSGRTGRIAAGLSPLFLVAAIGAGSGGAGATGGHTIRPDALIYFFDQIALRQQEPPPGVRPKWVRRWNGPVAVTLSGEIPAGFGARLDRSLADISRWTGQRFARAAGAAKAPRRKRISIRIVPHAAMLQRYGPGGHVCTAATFGWNGRLHTARIEISDRYTDCLDHELMHALGFDGHWLASNRDNAIRSVLARRDTPARRLRFTRFDTIAIRTLYHQTLAPGMARENALAQARRILKSPPRL